MTIIIDKITKKIDKIQLYMILESKKFYQKNNSSIWIYGIFKLPHLRKIQTPRKESQPYGLTTGSAGGLDEPLRGIFRYRL